MTLLRYLWASPATLAGLLLAAIALLGGARARCIQGVIEVGGGGLHRVLARLPEGMRFGAITLGHVTYRGNCFEAEAFAREARR